ncbi:MAG: hypothetical protein RLN69_14730, partial [Woeseiaceae bacterium]
MPSLIYASSGSRLEFSKGKTATEFGRMLRSKPETLVRSSRDAGSSNNHMPVAATTATADATRMVAAQLRSG